MALLLAALLALAPPPKVKDCTDSLDVAIFTSPRLAHAGSPLRVLVVSEQPIANARLVARAPDGTTTPLAASPRGGPPYGWVARLEKPAVGAWRFTFGSGDAGAACQDTVVHDRRLRLGHIVAGTDPVWKARIKWERDTENLFSLWVEHLFESPVDSEPSWRPLSVAMRDPAKNLLFDHLNLDEDRALDLAPDCADFPYFLRAVFAWKMGLPFGYRGCGRGDEKRAPSCGLMLGNDHLAEADGRVAAFQHFLRREVMRYAQSSSARTAPETDQSDFYPVALTRRSLRPGTVFADPYGHVLVVSQWVPGAAGTPGILFAVDAQPDATVGRRRFWRGSFLFPEDGSVRGAGFKRFRPVVRKLDQGYFGLTNARIASSVDYHDVSMAQWTGGKDAFYEAMDALINPEPLAPEVAFTAVLDALTEEVKRRVQSVDNGEEWLRANPTRVIPMPVGSAIFQTEGAWEDYSTPSRDLRLLIAIQALIDFPARLTRYPARFAIPKGTTPDAVRKDIEARLQRETAARRFEYTRSDGSKVAITVGDVIARRKALEMAYNPNDCPEHRWGAPDGSAERATCRREAPADQKKKMGLYRPWFAERRRPVK